MNGFISTILSFFLASADFSELSDAIIDLLKSMWTPCISVASALSVLWMVYLGANYARSAGDEQKKRSAKSAIVAFVIGIIVIFVGAVGVPMAIAALVEWVSSFV